MDEVVQAGLAVEGVARDATDVAVGVGRLSGYSSSHLVDQRTTHPLGVVDVYAGLFEGLEFKPGLHVNYESTIMPMKDGLPKFKDFPEDFGGSGETLPE